jgi:non-specific protein-tyrosine kinase
MVEDARLGEGFAALAENLLSTEELPGRLLFTASERGDGCSTLCLGLGSALARRGCSTAVVDCDLGQPGLHLMSGETNFRGLTGYVEGEKPPEHYGFEPEPGLLVLPSGPIPTAPAATLGSGDLIEAVRSLGQGREAVLLDAPPVGEIAHSPAFVESADGTLLVVNAGLRGKREARDAAAELRRHGRLTGTVLNGC